jgi:hypothetical protein
MFQTDLWRKSKHILCSIASFWKSWLLWDNVDKYGTAGQTTDDNIIRRMRIACWVTNAKGTRSEYVKLIDFPRQHWLRERTSMLRDTYIACLAYNYINN